MVLSQRAEFDEIKDYREFTTQERKALRTGRNYILDSLYEGVDGLSSGCKRSGRRGM